MKKNQITLSDIAKKLNVSKVTVSKAMRDHPDIGVETKNRVKKMALELGYMPNLVARNLSAKKSKTIGLVVPKIAHHFFARAIESIYHTAFENDYEIIMAVSQENPEFEERHIRTLLSMRVDGLLVSITEKTLNPDVFKLARDRGVPLLFFDRVITNQGYSCITTDDEKGAYELTRQAIDDGHKKIAHLSGYQNVNIGKGRFKGYKKALNDAGLKYEPSMVVEGGFANNDGYSGFKKLIRKNAILDAIFAVTYPVALGAYNAACELGIRIPKDISLYCFGGGEDSSYLPLPITFLDQPSQDIGKMAVEQLLEEMNSDIKNHSKEIVLAGKIVRPRYCGNEEK